MPGRGKRVRGSVSGRPIMALLDLLGRRWTLRIMWELRNGDRMNFRALRTACGEPSPTVLNTRLRELRDSGLAEHVPGQGYGLTAMGISLLELLLPLHVWAEGWAVRMSKSDE